MGLDIYLYTKAQEEQNEAHEAASEAWWEEVKDLSDEERSARRKTANIPDYASQEDVPSERYPDHLFNRRYLRSSYNGRGFNRAVPDFLGEDRSLDWIFEPVKGDSDEYSFEMTEASIAALEQAKDRSLQVADELRKCDPLRVETASALIGHAAHLWDTLPTEEQVLQWYRDEKAQRGEQHPDGGYSGAKGTVLGFTSGLDVLAITLGKDCLGRPAAVFVYRSQAIDSYIQSAEITAEFCDEAIGLIRRDGSVFMRWSG